ncbi:uncharacterized protein PAC_14389 [Phialocephala subalpina]|uniref:ABC transporter domain-containing protein n=1 Tax=Phialocephala subalpina TaxID=576137 RepID=A0A1L7XHI5_9HELO|nr:uncharacterized protein PAC_14389 [Phialocephala subalpina]
MNLLDRADYPKHIAMHFDDADLDSIHPCPCFPKICSYQGNMTLTELTSHLSHVHSIQKAKVSREERHKNAIVLSERSVNIQTAIGEGKPSKKPGADFIVTADTRAQRLEALFCCTSHKTGAGESSLSLSLFRIIEPSDGSISIDNLSTSTIGLLDLRQRLTIIPQDTALFEGTIRVLEYARLKDHVASMTGGLEAKVYEGGSNLSQGQKQLLSLARALFTPTTILVLDEATAAVDVETDTLLQETLHNSSFSNRTIITIAHRINTIIDRDRIVVLDKGEVAEFDTPAALILQKGLFYEPIKEAGLLESAVAQN